MDITRIDSFMSYTPTFENDPRKLLEEVLKKAPYLSKKDKKLVVQAYEYSLHYHKDIKRLSWEPYIIHPVKVLWFLMIVRPDVPSMQAALLHDLIEDTEVTYEDVQTAFGEEVATLCEWLVKVATVRYRGGDRQTETLKKTFLAMGKDLRVIIIKLADRVHNIQTLHYHPKKEKRTRIAQETLKVYVPIAKRLWLYIFQWYLENWAFAQLKPREYKRIYKYVTSAYGDVNTYKKQWITMLQELCDSESIPHSSVVGRLKSPYRISTKLKKYQNDIGKIMDVLAFRIVTESIADCYSVLWIIHKHYTPIFSKMKDYIAIPKPNGYKSLHTTVLGMFDFPVEIQVRTKDMEEIANYWVAAHFAYMEEGGSVSVSDAQNQWINKLQDIAKKYQEVPDKGDFKHELDVEILQENIFIYTPNGDIIELPQKSTVLDFAFRVHTDIGLKFKNGFINNRIVPIDYKLKTGDIVSIATFKNKFTASSWWMRFLHTPSAKTKLLRYLRQQEKDVLFAEVTEKINRKLTSLDLPLFNSKKDRITKEFSGEALERLMYRVLDRQLTVTKLIKDFYPETAVSLEKIPDKQIVEDKPKVGRVIIDENKIVDYELCPECQPQTGNKIISRTWKDSIKVHKLSCTALKTIVPKKLLEAHWDGEKAATYILRLALDGEDKPWVLLEMLKIFENLWINVLNLSTEMQEEAWWTRIHVDLVFNNPSKISFLLKELKTKGDSLKITSKTIR